MHLPSCQALLIGTGCVMALADRSHLPGAGAVTLQRGFSSLSKARGTCPFAESQPCSLFLRGLEDTDRKTQPPTSRPPAINKQRLSWRQPSSTDGQTDRKGACISSFRPVALLQCLSFGPGPGQHLSGTHTALLSTPRTHTRLCSVGAEFRSCFTKSSLSPAAYLQTHLPNTMAGTRRP